MADRHEPSTTHAVILSGGGANGAYEVGVMKALFGGHVSLPDYSAEQLKLDPFHLFSGTSVGAFNAAFMVSRPGQSSAKTLCALESVWRERMAGTTTHWNGVFRIRGNAFDFLDVNRVLASPMTPPAWLMHDGAFFAKDLIERTETFFRSKEEITRRFADLIDFSALISIEPLHDLVRELIDLDQMRANTERLVAITATNWEKGETELFTNRPVREGSTGRPLDDKIGHLAILASTAIPGIFPPVEIHNTKYVDGGLLMNTPLSPAIRAGADVLHVIYLDPDLKDVPLHGGGGTFDVLNRLVALAFANQVNRDIKNLKGINQVLDLSERITTVLKSRSKGSGRDSALDEIAPIWSDYTKGRDDLRKLTVHRYHPSSILDGGVFGLLNFDASRVSAMIDRGFQDAVMHDCAACGCIFPTAAYARRVREGRAPSASRAQGRSKAGDAASGG
jgi:NTE family protein